MLDRNIQQESLSIQFHEPLIPLALGVIGGILFGQALPGDWRIALAAALLSAGLWAFAARRRSVYAHWVAGVAVFFWISVARTEYVDSSPVPQLDAGPREVVTVEACVVSFPAFEKERTVFWAELAPGARMRVSWYDTKAAAPLRYGQRLEMAVRAKRVRNAGNPGSFDAERYLRHRQIYWNANVAAAYPVRFLDGECGNRLQAWIYSGRAALLARIAELAGPDDYLRAMLGALLLGDNSQIERAWTETYRQTGTYHAIVVSGLHVTVLAASLAGVLRFLFLPKLPTLLLCSLLAIVYALLCDLSAPVIRAAGGFLLYSLAQVFYRHARTLNLLAAVAIVVLLADPEQLFEGSFLLSFLAVLALGALASPLQERWIQPWRLGVYRLEESKLRLLDPVAADLRLDLELAATALAGLSRLPRRAILLAIKVMILAALFCAELALSSAVVLVGLSLPTVLFFHRLSFVSLSANLPVVVLLSAGVVAGFVGLLVGPAAAPLLAWLLDLSRRSVDWHLQWDSGTRVPDPPAWLLAGFPLLLLLCALAARVRPRLALAPAAGALACFAYLAMHPFRAEPRLDAGKLELTAVDIGQGDALFVATPGGHLALLDGGGSRSERFDPGEAVLSPYLWSRHIGNVHTLIASHGDLDHIGGLLAAYDNFQPREVWVSSQIQGDLWERLRAKAGPRVRRLAAGDRVALGDLPVEVLWPPRELPIEKPNLASLVLLAQHGRHRFLLTGDIDASVENQLLARGLPSKIDVLKVAHHGSRSSTSEAFLASTRPTLAIVSAGWANPFGHPHPSVTARLAAAKSLVLRTDELGQIRILSDGRRLEAEPFAYRERGWRSRVPILAAVE